MSRALLITGLLILVVVSGDHENYLRQIVSIKAIDVTTYKETVTVPEIPATGGRRGLPAISTRVYIKEQFTAVNNVEFLSGLSKSNWTQMMSKLGNDAISLVVAGEVEDKKSVSFSARSLKRRSNNMKSRHIHRLLNRSISAERLIQQQLTPVAETKNGPRDFILVFIDKDTRFRYVREFLRQTERMNRDILAVARTIDGYLLIPIQYGIVESPAGEWPDPESVLYSGEVSPDELCNSQAMVMSANGVDADLWTLAPPTVQPPEDVYSYSNVNLVFSDDCNSSTKYKTVIQTINYSSGENRPGDAVEQETIELFTGIQREDGVSPTIHVRNGNFDRCEIKSLMDFLVGQNDSCGYLEVMIMDGEHRRSESAAVSDSLTWGQIATILSYGMTKNSRKLHRVMVLNWN